MRVFNRLFALNLLLFPGRGLSCAESPALHELRGGRFVVDLKYGTEGNFLKTNVYGKFGLDQCYVRPELWERLQRLAALLTERKLKLVLFDCYRPLEVQREMWKIVQDPKYVADPKRGSNHNRAAAVDAALAAEDGALLVFPTPFDDFTLRASHSFDCPKGLEEACRNRELLKRLMIEAGLKPLSSEWWHYELPDAKKYPLIERTHVQPQ